MSAAPTRRKVVVGITGASGSIYARALVDALTSPMAGEVEVAAVLSQTAPEVWAHELGTDVRAHLAARGVSVFSGRDYRAPFASGSAGWDAMVVAPCSMSSVAKIAHGISDDLLSRAADVMLKERRRLVVLPRETPLSTLHLENLLALARHGAVILPAMPSFYGRPATIDEVVDTVVTRALDHLGFSHGHARRWGRDVTMESALVPSGSASVEEPECTR
jgi:4-hydroxy-3-polyprenylbenzoate decarboxylase